MKTNKRKIINDPVYGFITIHSELIFDIIEHPYFQRLRRIKQLGLTDMVYPGALHTRFHHAIGAMHLMYEALNTLKSKGHPISEAEFEAAQIAILLHDVGHGPFSHALENSLLNHIHHEEVSLLIMKTLNEHFEGKLGLAILMFSNKYERKFFNQLISSQLDIDRLDYLNRDSFFTGVTEASIGSERIIKMLSVHKGELVVEQKGIYSVENFLSARRLMYWQVYLHKTAISAELMLVLIIKRAKELSKNKITLPCTNALKVFIENDLTFDEFQKNTMYLISFAQLDDYDIWAAIKLWVNEEDFILKTLCTKLLNRDLFKIELFDAPILEKTRKNIFNKIENNKYITSENKAYFIVENEVTNAAYVDNSQSIKVLNKESEIIEISEASDLPTIKALSKLVKKYYICWANDVSL